MGVRGQELPPRPPGGAPPGPDLFGFALPDVLADAVRQWMEGAGGDA